MAEADGGGGGSLTFETPRGTHDSAAYMLNSEGVDWGVGTAETVAGRDSSESQAMATTSGPDVDIV